MTESLEYWKMVFLNIYWTLEETMKEIKISLKLGTWALTIKIRSILKQNSNIKLYFD